MKPATQGKRARELRKLLGASQRIIEELSGLSHAQVSKAESQNTGWRSSDVRDGFSRAYSMTAEQWTDYIEGRMLIEQAAAIARPRIEEAKRTSGDESEIEAIAKTAVKMANVDEEWVPSTVQLMRVVVRRRGVRTPMSELVAEASRWAKNLPTYMARAQTAHKSDRTGA